ncbi:MAG: hypothetical protein J7J73_01570 [Deltaproteobacteria bacterium]|nr:hypothetical protein [Deltaproteobacteria bacterium]
MNLFKKTLFLSITSSIVFVVCLSFFYYTSVLKKDVDHKLKALDICFGKVQQEKQKIDSILSFKEEIKKEGLSIGSTPTEINAKFAGKDIATVINYINSTYYGDGLFFIEKFTVYTGEDGVQYAIEGRKF